MQMSQETASVNSNFGEQDCVPDDFFFPPDLNLLKSSEMTKNSHGA